MRYDLPTAVEVNGTEYQIRSDYRDILTIIEALSDAELSEEEKAEAMLMSFGICFIHSACSTFRRPHLLYFILSLIKKRAKRSVPTVRP